MSTSIVLYKAKVVDFYGLGLFCIVQQFECLAVIKPPVQIEKPTLKKQKTFILLVFFFSKLRAFTEHSKQYLFLETVMLCC